MRKIVVLVLVMLTMAGCSTAPLTPVDTQPPSTTTSSVENNLESEKVSVIKLVPTEFSADITYVKDGKFLSEWKTNEEEVIVNGAYFNPDYSPSGFLVIDNKKISSRLFDQDKSGLVVIKDGALSIRDLGATPLKPKESFDYALQSYPFLIKEGKPALTTDSGKRARRTALGIDKEKNVYIFMATTYAPTLFEFMQQIIKLKLPLTSVLNLDGGPSTGIISNWQEKEVLVDSYTKIGSMLRFIKK